MDEYIKKEDIEQKIQDGLNNLLLGHDAIEVMGMIYEMPAADVAQVMHGRWLCVDTDTEQFFLCNRCKKKEYWESDYCPSCGCRMDLEEAQNGKQS